jgi:uncharacterized protein YndB with AHSA1/START domain
MDALRPRLLATMVVVAALAVALPARVAADVLEATPNTFAIAATRTSNKPPALVYAALTRELPRWWDPQHTWSGNARNLKLDARAGGCFCERLVNRGSAEHATVIMVQAPKLLRLRGALGPLQQMPVAAVLSFELEPQSSGSKIALSYRVAGQFTIDAKALAAGVDQVLSAQLDRLVKFVDR